MSKKTLNRSAMFATGLAVLHGAAVAAPATQDDIDALDQKIRILERKLEIEREEEAEAAGKLPVLGVSDEGFNIESADGLFELKFRALVQGDSRVFVDDEDTVNDTFLMRRVRPTLDGAVGEHVSFRITPDFAGSSTTLVDAYADVGTDLAALRIGKFKGPVILERLQSGSNLHFTERSYVSELGPNRDIGAQLLGDVLNETLSYALAITNGMPDGRDSPATNPDDNFEYTARLFAEPIEGLGFGIAGSIGDKEGGGDEGSRDDFLPRYRSPGQQTIFEYADGVAADGEHLRWSPQAYYYGGPFGAMAEYIQSEIEITNGVAADTLKHDAAQGTLVFVLTGEEASYSGVKPDKPVGSGGWGAWELAARYAQLDLDDDTFPLFADSTGEISEAKTWGLGVNWYLTGNVKAVVNYFHTSFDGGDAAGDLRDEQAMISRLQLSF